MTIEDVVEKADKWSQLVSRLSKSLAAAAIAVGGAVGGIVMLWPGGEDTPPPAPAGIVAGQGYSPQCSQLMNSIDHNWTESQWAVWERLRRDIGC